MIFVEILLTDEDFQRLELVRQSAGEKDLSCEEYASLLLTKELRRLHPELQ